MSRLPVVGQDDDIWGEILNDFLSVEHNADGTLKRAGTIAGAVQSVNGNNGPTVTLTASDVGAATDSAVVHKSGTETISGVKTFSASPIVPDPSSSTQVANKNYVDTVAGSGAPDATTSSKGVIQLAGDLGGTAAAPTVPGLSTKENTISTGTTSQYYRGDKTWQTLDKTAVGLTNVDNTSDLNKPVSTATQTALNGKINSSEKGAANGVAQLDGSGKVNPGQLQTSNITKVLPYSYLGNVVVNVGSFRLYNDTGSTWTITGVRASVGTAPAGAAILIDINKNGTTIFTTQANRPSIAAAANTSGNVTNMDVTTVAAGEYLTVDIDQIGTTTSGADLTVQVEVY